MNRIRLRHSDLLTLVLVTVALGCGSKGSASSGDGDGDGDSDGAGGAISASSGGSGEGGSGDGGGSVSQGGEGGMGPVPITWPKPCPDLYDPELLPTFELTFTSEELQNLQNDCEASAQTYRPATFTYGSETVDVMVRLKGNWSWDCSKMQFVVSFNELDSKRRFHGQRKLVFDAPWYDRTVLHERVAMQYFEERGLPYSCVNNARVMLNGEYYGLFANVERLDKEYLERHFEESDGNLYQGGVELKTNEDVNDTSDLEALNAVSNVTELAMRMDLDQAIAEWASEAMLPAIDNYWAGVEINHYIYNHPTRGFLHLPYDMDIVFGAAAYTDGSLIAPDAASLDPIIYEHSGWLKELRVEMVLSDPEWCEKFVDELELARAAYSPAKMSAQVDEWDAQIRDALADDPNKQFTAEDHDDSIEILKASFSERAEFVDAWLAEGGHCPGEF